ncbi:hypothetical protein Vadar_016207 [Vaccinium darrowii]|uniref:Uncharacterized protein n=1 Tax=Vaccinium darrowii TaxID=229202 RepID=A0ACB7YWV4_9ERIC|nr:hypothetical protein Vadar_016207 [Vaccinium darrowii]
MLDSSTTSDECPLINNLSAGTWSPIVTEDKDGFCERSTSTWSLSPVMLDSSNTNKCPSMNNPSAGTWSPIFKKTTSPMTILKMETCCYLLLLTTLTWILLITLDNLTSCLFFLKLHIAEIAMRRRTTTNMLPPLYLIGFR